MTEMWVTLFDQICAAVWVVMCVILAAWILWVLGRAMWLKR